VKTSDLAFPFSDDVGGTIRGYRIFTAARTVNGKVFRQEDHLSRLYKFAESIHMKPPMQREGLRDILRELLDKNQAEAPGCDFRIEVIFSGGLLDDTMKQSGKGAYLYVAVQRLVQPSREMYEQGVALATFPHRRMWAEVKWLNYVAAILAHQTVVPQRNAYEVLYVDPEDGRTLLEGSTFTVFFVDSTGAILTPPLDGRILDSITRRVIFELLEPRTDLTIRESAAYLDELSAYPEAFLASTTRGILPVVRIDGTTVGSGIPGPVTRGAMAVFQAYLESY
jgi:branched-chain amino acid aminotransferase